MNIIPRREDITDLFALSPFFPEELMAFFDIVEMTEDADVDVTGLEYLRGF